MGKIKFRCSKCNEKNARVWGCVDRTEMAEPTFQEEERGIIYRYWNCPIKFVPMNIWKFLEVYDYYKQFPSAPAPSFENVSRRFLKAFQYYESKFNEGMAKVMKEK